jgi:SAM-dependent methyltransferase
MPYWVRRLSKKKLSKKGERLTDGAEIKNQVRQFYNSVGWKQIGDGVYQNARYEDLRPVSREYIHRCHLRVSRFLPGSGRFLLDGGSGPIQYPEYLEYSKGFQYRVCLDISSLALKEARERLGDRGLYVVGDIARLPFKREAFDGVVSLHTIHHLPADEHEMAFKGLLEVMKPKASAVIVYTWGEFSPLMRFFSAPIQWAESLIQKITQRRRLSKGGNSPGVAEKTRAEELVREPGTFTTKHDYKWIKTNLRSLPGLEVRVWRTVSTKFMRALVHGKALGRLWLRILFGLEELAPRFFGRIGQYPLILFHKPDGSTIHVERSK